MVPIPNRIVPAKTGYAFVLYVLGAAALLIALSGVVPSFAADSQSAGRDVSTTQHDDPNLHLFLDDEDVEKVENLQRMVNRPRKHPAPVLVSDHLWGRRTRAGLGQRDRRARWPVAALAFRVQHGASPR